MLVPLRQLLDRRRHGAVRADTHARLRARFRAHASPRESRAEALIELKRALLEAFGEVRSCVSCASGCAAPAGRFEGGRCCGTDTLTVFSPEEVRALSAAGQRPPPLEDHPPGDAGCIFRGPRGCSAQVEARPVRCLLYVCDELSEELADNRAGMREVRARRRALRDAFERAFEHPSTAPR